MAVDFCSRVLFEVGPASRTVKKSGGDKVWKMHFIYKEDKKASKEATTSQAAKVVIKTAFVCTFKANEMGNEGPTETKITLSVKQASLLAMETFIRLIGIAASAAEPTLLMTPLAGAIFSRNDVPAIAAHLNIGVHQALVCINASAQSGGQYLKYQNGKAASMECAATCSIVTTSRLKSVKDRKQIVSKVLKQYKSAKFDYNKERAVAWMLYANGGLPVGINHAEIHAFYKECRKYRPQDYDLVRAQDMSLESACRTLGIEVEGLSKFAFKETKKDGKSTFDVAKVKKALPTAEEITVRARAKSPVKSSWYEEMKAEEEEED